MPLCQYRESFRGATRARSTSIRSYAGPGWFSMQGCSPTRSRGCAEKVGEAPMAGLHVCCGLNECAGQGKNGSGTMAVDGQCATVQHHCAGDNSCAGLGG